MNDLKEIIGMQCTYNYGDNLSLWNDNNTILCKIINTYAYIDERSLAKDLIIGICLIPIEEHNLDDDELDYMRSGVDVDTVHQIAPIINK